MADLLSSLLRTVCWCCLGIVCYTQLDDKNFKETVLKSDGVWLVEFYAPWCGKYCLVLQYTRVRCAALRIGAKYKYGLTRCECDIWHRLLVRALGQNPKTLHGSILLGVDIGVWILAV